MNSLFRPRFTITNRIASSLTRIERARGFLEAATLSENWVREMGNRALVLEAHHTTHIEGTQLTLEQSERLCPGVTRRTLQRDIKLMVEKGLVAEKATSPTDPTKYYALLNSSPK